VPHFTLRSASDARSPRLLAVAVVVALLTLFATVASPVQATPEDPAGDESAFVASLNATRATAGGAPLTVDSELQSLARGWAEQMAAAGHISHANPISAGVTADWLKLGENVGTGGNVTVIMNAFIASPGHYANIMDPEFTRVGVGVVWVGNALYTVHRFMKVSGESASGPAQSPPPATDPPAAPEPTAAPDTTAPKNTAPPSTSPKGTGGTGVGAARQSGAPPTTTTAAPPPPTPPPAKASRVASVLAALRGASG
jgi:uncharacterized protein YkwD